MEDAIFFHCECGCDEFNTSKRVLPYKDHRFECRKCGKWYKFPTMYHEGKEVVPTKERRI